jgi:predicted tellurium resistance membrane protein TerC
MEKSIIILTPAELQNTFLEKQMNTTMISENMLQMKSKNNTNMLEERTVNTKVKLAILWVALMFLYIYNDIFSLYQPGHVADLVEGHLEGVRFTQSLLFGAALLMAIPSFMVLMSLSLKARANRLVNIIIGILHILVLIGTQFVGEGETWYYWSLYELLEALFLALIIRTAWKWPNTESQYQ